jgi:hypothetical protein
MYPDVRIHKESYVLIEELTKSLVSLNPFLSQVVTKTDLELLTITKMGNTNFLSHLVLRLKLNAIPLCVPGSNFTHKATNSEINSKPVFITT